MSDSYLPGAAVLAHSLRDAGTAYKLAVLVTLETLSADTITQLKLLYDYLIPVERIRTPNPANLYLMGRPDLTFAFTKIALWRQTQFRKIVYLDADVVALRALDELFAIDAPFAAAPDIGWPDAFNSGVMVITPDMGEYWALQTMAATGDSFDGADQGLLNQYFEHRPWQRLKFTYNCTPNAEYQWEPAYRYYKRDISAVHFIGKNKPWSGQHPGGSGVYGELLARWWAVHNRHLNRPNTASGSVTRHEQTPVLDETPSAQNDIPPQSRSFGHTAVVEPEALVATAEPSLSESGDMIQDVTNPSIHVPGRNFSAPEMQWDATKCVLFFFLCCPLPQLTRLGLSRPRSRGPKLPIFQVRRIPSVTAVRSSRLHRLTLSPQKICGMNYPRPSPRQPTSRLPFFHGSMTLADPELRAFLLKTHCTIRRQQ